MTRVPAIRNSDLAFRGRASSGDYNQKNEETYLDMMELFDATNQMESELKEITETFQMNNRFQHLYIKKMESRLLALQQKLKNRVSGEVHHVHTIAAEEMTHDPNAITAERAFIDPVYSVVHLPITGPQSSKVYLRDAATGVISMPKALRAQAVPAALAGARIEENDVLNCLDGSNDTRWQRRVIFPLESSPAQTVSTELIVTLPDTIISSRNANLVTLKVFPVNSLWIDKVETRIDGDWQLLPGWNVDAVSGAPVAVEDAGYLKLAFPDMEIKELKITLSQYNWFDEAQEKVYHFGLEEVGVFHVNHQLAIGRLDIPVTLRGTGGTRVLRSLTPLIENKTALSGAVNDLSSVMSYSIYTIDKNDELHYTKDAFPVITTNDRILIRAVLHADRYNGATPVISAVDLAYDDVY